MAATLQTLAERFKHGSLSRGELLKSVNELAAASESSAIAVLDEVRSLHENSTLDPETSELLQETVRLTVGTTFLGTQYRQQTLSSGFPTWGISGETGSLHDLKNAGPIVEAGTILRERFVIDSVVGVGGMGTVYKGRDLLRVQARDRNPYIAIKILNEDVKSHMNTFLALQREAARQQKLAHPNITTVYDFDRAGDTYFLTMELLEGTPLDRYIRQKVKPNLGLSREDGIRIVEELGAALSYAHEHDLIHSDFKPGNCFITNEGRIKVLDFGIARAIRLPDEEDRTVIDGETMGAMTPAYATLEMLERSAPAHPSDDVFALGCVAYELFSGSHPFGRLPATIASREGLKPKSLDRLHRRQNRALQKALAFNRRERFQSVDEFLEEFRDPDARERRTVLALTATGVVVAAVIVHYLGGAIEHQREASIVADLTSNDPSRIRTAVTKIESLAPKARRRLLDSARNGLSPYLSDAIRRMAADRDFAAADSAVARARRLYPDSAQVEAAASFAFQEKNRVIAELRDDLEAALASSYLLSESGDAGIPALIAKARLLTNDELISMVRLEEAYLDAFDAALDASNLDLASRFLNTALDVFEQQPPSLLNASDRLITANKSAQIAFRVDALEQKIAGTLENLSLDVLDDIAKDVKQLYAIAPESDVIGDVKAVLTAFVEENGLTTGEVGLSQLRRFEPKILDVARPLRLDDLTAKVESVSKSMEEQFSRLVSKIRANAVAPTPIEPALQELGQDLQRLLSLEPDKDDIVQLKADTLMALDDYASRAFDESRHVDARRVLEFSKSLDPSPDLAAEIDRRLGEINRRIDADAALAEGERKAQQVVSLQQAITKLIPEIESPDDVVRAFRLISDLERIAADRPKADSYRERVEHQTVVVAKQHDGSLAALSDAIAFLEESASIVGNSPKIAHTLAELKASLSTRRTEQREAFALAAEKDFRRLLEQASTESVTEWAGQMSSAISLHSDRLGQDHPIIVEATADFGRLVGNDADRLASSGRFSAARDLLARGQEIVGSNAYLTSLEKRVATMEKEAAAQRRESLANAELSDLEDTFAAHIAAQQLERAESAFEKLSELWPVKGESASRASTVLAEAFLEKARTAFSADDRANAGKLLERSLAYAADGSEVRAAAVELAATMKPVTSYSDLGSLSVDDVIGKWCSSDVDLVLGASQYSYLVDGQTVTYKVQGFDFNSASFSLRWQDSRLGDMLTEYRLSANDSLIQLRSKRASDSDWKVYDRQFRRCE